MMQLRPGSPAPSGNFAPSRLAAGAQVVDGDVCRAAIETIGNSPIQDIAVRFGARAARLQLKLEGSNPGGSIKDRTALALIRDLQLRGLAKPGCTIIELTSGNLGVALAYLCRHFGYRFIAVIDPKTTPENIAKLETSGAVLDRVTQADETGGYLLSRLRRVQELINSIPGALWPNQYENPANVRAHFEGTGPELFRQTKGNIDAIFMGVSTGGTLAGVSRYLRAMSPRIGVVAVDAEGSVALGGRPAQRFLTGIGSSRSAGLIADGDYDEIAHVGDAEAFACCRALAARTGILVGGSSGAVLAAALQRLRASSGEGRFVCICPDTGQNYRSSIFDDAILAALPEIRERQAQFETVIAAVA